MTKAETALALSIVAVVLVAAALAGVAVLLSDSEFASRAANAPLIW